MPDIPEEYYYSTLSAEEIEDRLLHMVPYNKNISLSAEEKALFRANIDAGQTNAGFVVLGYFETLEDMQESLTQLPKAGDAYGIANNESGTEFRYNIYVYDGYHKIWVNNGPLDTGNAIIADDQVSISRTWSSSKINSSLNTLENNKQNKITTNGILKGNGSGGVSAAIAGTDYLTPATNYSLVQKVPRNQTYALTVADVGKTFWEQWSSDASMNTVAWSLTAENSANIPVGAEIAFTSIYVANSYLSISGVRCSNVDLGEFVTKTTSATVKFEKRSMIALKKLETNASVGDVWLLTGNAEVQS